MSANYSKFMDTNRNLIIPCSALLSKPTTRKTISLQESEMEREREKATQSLQNISLGRNSLVFCFQTTQRHNSICAHRQILITLLRTLHCTTTPYNSSFTVQCRISKHLHFSPILTCQRAHSWPEARLHSSTACSHPSTPQQRVSCSSRKHFHCRRGKCTDVVSGTRAPHDCTE